MDMRLISLDNLDTERPSRCINDKRVLVQLFNHTNKLYRYVIDVSMTHFIVHFHGNSNENVGLRQHHKVAALYVIGIHT